MDIYRVRYFHVFANTGSLVKACEVLHISQPALSKALRLLEQEVGASLLESEGRNLKLTAAGQRFKTLTAPLLDQWLSVKDSMVTVEQTKMIRIASFEVFTTHFLMHLQKFIALAQLELQEHRPGQLERVVAEGRADIGITYAPIPVSGVDFTEVTQIKMGVFGVKAFKNREFSELPFVVPLLPVEGTPSKVQGLDGWPDHRYARKVSHRVTMMESALELCRQGHCVAFLPEFVVHLHNQKTTSEFQLIELSSPLLVKERKQSVFIIQKQGSQESKLVRDLAKSLRAIS